MKATSLLKQHHRDIKKALAQLIKGGQPAGEADRLRAQMADELIAHMMIEEKIFYPRARDAMKKPDLVDLSFEEHGLARYALIRLLEAEPSDAVFQVRAKSLKKLLEEHIEEEETILFPVVEKALGAAEMKAITAEMTELFAKTMEGGHENGMRALELEPAHRGARRSEAAKAIREVRATPKSDRAAQAMA